MRIVQTFWTAGRNPLEHSFGWLRPEYNLMSWALSCLSLREHYDEVALYTDEQGKHVLIDLLHLPYTEVHVVYDEHLCLPQHWAYAKIKTYSLQTKPFLHVDGDVYLPKPVSEDIMDAPLIAQNREKGTKYYRRLMDNFGHESVLELPVYMEESLNEESIPSYNMGVFGGNDLDFIHAFCEEAMTLCITNETNCSNGNFNLLFEQMLFASLADLKGTPVSTICSRIYNDNGYTTQEFCQLNDYEHRSYFHLLGGHKRNRSVLKMLVHTMIRLQLHIFRRILNLCPQFPSGIFERMHTPDYSMEEVRPYLDFIETKRKEWGELQVEALIGIEGWTQTNDTIQRVVKGEDSSCTLCLSPYMTVFVMDKKCSEEAGRYLCERLRCGPHFPLREVALIPTLSGYGYMEIPLLPIDMKIAEILESAELTIEELKEKALRTYFDGAKNDFRIRYIQSSIERLIANQIINLKIH